jgi:hypothetical protein
MGIKGIALIVLGIMGGIFVSVFDIVTGKSVNDVSGPKSITALILCGILVIAGVGVILKSAKKEA